MPRETNPSLKRLRSACNMTDSFEKNSVRSSDRFRQWFAKLQSLIPASFTRNNSKPEPPSNLPFEGGSGDNDVLCSEENLDVIMDTLRSDLITVLGDSRSNKSVKKILYKLNTIDSGIRKVCHFHKSWSGHPNADGGSLKSQETHIVKLIEELMDDIFETYCYSKSNHSPFHARSINGVICVLSIMKNEVSNTIHTIIALVEAHKTKKKRSKSNSIIDQQSQCNSNNKANIKETSFVKSNTLSNSYSYPMLAKKKPFSFQSEQNVFYLKTENPFWNNTAYRPKSTEDISEDSQCSIKYSCHDTKKNDIRTNIDDASNQLGDSEKNISIPTAFHVSSIPEKSNYIEASSDFFGSIQSYFRKKNTVKTLPYEKNQLNHEDNVYFDQKNLDKFKKQLVQRSSTSSWPIATLIRNAKSDCRLDLIKPNVLDCLKTVDVFNYSDSDDSDSSDSSYFSCALDDFKLSADFLSHIKEECMQTSIQTNESPRNKIDCFSCKSPKMTQVFYDRKPIEASQTSSHLKPEVYLSVESIPCFDNYLDYVKEMTGKNKKNIKKDAAIGTEKEMSEILFHLQADEQPYNTLAFPRVDDSSNRITPILSLTSVISESINKFNDNRSESDYCSFDQLQLTTVNQTDLSPNLEDSLYSSVCLPTAPCKVKATNCYTEGKDKLWALEININ